MDRAKRAGRGANIQKLMKQQADDAEDEVWGDEAVAAVFAEEADDEGYETEKSEEDLADSDFFESESDSDGEADGAAADKAAEDRERRERRKAHKAPGTRPAAARVKATGKAKAGAGASGGGTPRPKRPPPPRTKAGEERRSSRALAVAAQAARQAAIAEAEAAARAAVPKRKRKVQPEVQLSQADLLAEAAVTEVYNRRMLAELLAREEETRRKAVVKKKRYAGPKVRIVDKAVPDEAAEGGRRADATLEFTGVDRVPRAINDKAPPPPPTVRCVISGRPARYFDPQTQQPYRGIEEFRALRAGSR